MRSFQKKISNNFKTRLIGSLVLFGIITQFLTPLTTFASHPPFPKNRWHDRNTNHEEVIKLGGPGNYPDLTVDQYDQVHKKIFDSKEAQINGFDKTFAKYKDKTPKELFELLELEHTDWKSNINLPELDKQGTGGNGCDYISWTPTCLIKRFLASIGYFFLQISAIFLNLASQIFDQSAKVSLSYQTYSSKHAVAVYEAWKAARNFVNMLFIFMILVIALSFILQIKDYGSQQVLIRLVMIAILINFSFFITQQVINFSNSAAMYFKNGILNSVNEGKPENEQMGIGDFFVEKLKPQILFSGYKADMKLDIGSQNPELAGKIKETLTDNPDISWLSIVITSIGGVIIILYAAFIFFAAAILFVLRTIVLWILMALAPFAFAAEIFPASRGSFAKWRGRLWNEIMFPPLMMFMFYFTAKILSKNFLETYVSQGQARTSFGNSAIFNYYLVLQYVFILMLLSFCVFFARSYGATGAQWVSKQENWLKNKAKNIGKTPINWTGRAIRRGAAGHIAESIATTENKGLGRFYKVTGLRRGAESIVASERAYAKTTDKRLGNLTSKELTSRLKTSFVGGTITKANMDLIQELQKRGDLGKVSPELMEKMHTYLSNIGENTKDIETYMPSLAGRGKTGAEKDNAIRKAVKRESADKVSEYLKVESEYEYKDGSASKDVVNARRKEWGESHMNKWVETANVGDKNAIASLLEMIKSYSDVYKAVDNRGVIDLEKVSKGLEGEQNFSAAKFINSAEGTKAFENFIKSNGGGSGFTGVKYSKGAVEEQGKKDVKILEANEIVDLIKAATTAQTNNTSDKEKLGTRVSELINVAGIDKIADMLKNLTITEEQGLKAILKSISPGLENKIISLRPESASSDERQKAFKIMTQKDIEGFDYDGLKDRISKITNATGNELNEILEDMIKGFTRTQYESLFKSGNDLTEAFIQKLKDASSSSAGNTPLAKVTAYLRSLPQSKNSVAGYIEGSPAAANSFK